MSKHKHTSGPWKVIVYPHVGQHHPWIEAESNHNGGGPYLSASGLMSMEDARLIAAAPDLLEALELLLSYRCDDVPTADWRKARAALSKAKGEA
jgi:hypothetical protein